MIILLDTSTPMCRLTLADGDMHYAVEWEAGRALANDLLSYLTAQLRLRGATWQDVTAIGVLQGPGSFTGLRIGLTVMNTVANAQHIPIVGMTGNNWQEQALQRLQAGDDDRIVMPEYGSEARITMPKK